MPLLLNYTDCILSKNIHWRRWRGLFWSIYWSINITSFSLGVFFFKYLSNSISKQASVLPNVLKIFYFFIFLVLDSFIFVLDWGTLEICGYFFLRSEHLRFLLVSMLTEYTQISIHYIKPLYNSLVIRQNKVKFHGLHSIIF